MWCSWVLFVALSSFLHTFGGSACSRANTASWTPRTENLVFPGSERGLIWKETLRFSNSDEPEDMLSDSLLCFAYFYTLSFESYVCWGLPIYPLPLLPSSIFFLLETLVQISLRMSGQPGTHITEVLLEPRIPQLGELWQKSLENRSHETFILECHGTKASSICHVGIKAGERQNSLALSCCSVLCSTGIAILFKVWTSLGTNCSPHSHSPYILSHFYHNFWNNCSC